MDATAAVVRTAINSTSCVSERLAGKGAFGLFRNPMGHSKLRPSEHPVMERARTGRLEVHGKSVATYHWGSGERPVLLVHGWESRGSRFSAFAAALLERGYSPVTFDAPGHGESTGKTTTILEYRDVITQLHAEHGDFEAVVAHSLGATASFFALRQGVRAGRVSVIGGVVDFDYVVEAFCSKLGLREQVRAELRGRIEHELFPQEADIWSRFSVVHEPERVSAPILVVQDENDDMVRPEQALRITAAYGDQARLVTTRRLGHRRILADAAVVTEVVDFVTADPSAAGTEAGARTR
ncbi:alpha/beta hydrolase [Streptacidiphilus sp. P02-A3a]|uniref:alpha/beta hydrolase n=1 Tax=Streptacidiphilus sp. P02-A3a TaxID=2704468 RepID=UPI0015FC900E|nr:alpha/beta hydrolase [Streptacidiphilus sp. P02-A3a]QMU71182.1 alpha/beta hydrolase [Streptacidiphilus sp. P02-A3a]